MTSEFWDNVNSGINEKQKGKSIYSKLSDKARNEIDSTLELFKGHVAHFNYGKAIDELSFRDFETFIIGLGISLEQFSRLKDKFCEDTIYKTCEFNLDSYCDPTYCHGQTLQKP